MGEVVTRYHISLDVADKAGVLAAVAQAFADTTSRCARSAGGPRRRRLARVATHTATDAALQAVVEELRRLDSVRAVASVMRVEERP
jgi:homoserine dehydrogenase